MEGLASYIDKEILIIIHQTIYWFKKSKNEKFKYDNFLNVFWYALKSLYLISYLPIEDFSESLAYNKFRTLSFSDSMKYYKCTLEIILKISNLYLMS